MSRAPGVEFVTHSWAIAGTKHRKIDRVDRSKCFMVGFVSKPLSLIDLKR